MLGGLFHRAQLIELQERPDPQSLPPVIEETCYTKYLAVKHRYNELYTILKANHICPTLPREEMFKLSGEFNQKLRLMENLRLECKQKNYPVL